MLWTGPWDLSSINSDVSYGVTLLPGYNGDHETISGPDLYMLFDHSSARSAAAVKFISWLTSAKVHIQFAIATGDLPLRKSETTLPEYQTFLQEVPGRAGLRREPQQRQARPAEHLVVRRGLDRGRARWCSRCCSAEPSRRPRSRPAARPSPRRWLVRELGGEGGGVPRAPTSRRGRPRTILPRPDRARSRRAAGPRRRGRRREAATAWAMVSPSVLLIGLFGLVPVVWAFCPVLPAQRPPDAGPVGRAEELPPAHARPAVLVLDPAHRRLHRAVRADHARAVAARRGRAEPADPRHHRLPARRVHPGRDLDHRHRGDLHLADGPGLRPDQRRPGQARPADVPVLRLARPGAARRGDHDRLGLGRLRRADLPGRAAGDPAGPDRRGPDRRLLAAGGVLADPGAAAPAGQRVPAGLADDQRAAAVRRGLRDDQGRPGSGHHRRRLLPVRAGLPVLPRRVRRGHRRRAVRRDRADHRRPAAPHPRAVGDGPVRR